MHRKSKVYIFAKREATAVRSPLATARESPGTARKIHPAPKKKLRGGDDLK